MFERVVCRDQQLTAQASRRMRSNRLGSRSNSSFVMSSEVITNRSASPTLSEGDSSSQRNAPVVRATGVEDLSAPGVRTARSTRYHPYAGSVGVHRHCEGAPSPTDWMDSATLFK